MVCSPQGFINQSKMTDNGEFKGTTKQAIVDIRKDIDEIKGDVKSMNKRILILFILLTVAIIERLPSLISLALAR